MISYFQDKYDPDVTDWALGKVAMALTSRRVDITISAIARTGHPRMSAMRRYKMAPWHEFSVWLLLMPPEHAALRYDEGRCAPSLCTNLPRAHLKIVGHRGGLVDQVMAIAGALRKRGAIAGE